MSWMCGCWWPQLPALSPPHYRSFNNSMWHHFRHVHVCLAFFLLHHGVLSFLCCEYALRHFVCCYVVASKGQPLSLLWSSSKVVWLIRISLLILTTVDWFLIIKIPLPLAWLSPLLMRMFMLVKVMAQLASTYLLLLLSPNPFMLA